MSDACQWVSEIGDDSVPSGIWFSSSISSNSSLVVVVVGVAVLV